VSSRTLEESRFGLTLHNGLESFCGTSKPDAALL
jgi:hypothetical protein